MIELLLVVIAMLLAFIYMDVRTLKKQNYIQLGMITETNGWDSKKVNEILEKSLDM
jgi:hypothetical protein